MFDLGPDGQGLTKVASVNQQAMTRDAGRIAQNIDKSNFGPLVGISVLNSCESSHVDLVAVTGSGVRLYFTTSVASHGCAFFWIWSHSLGEPCFRSPTIFYPKLITSDSLLGIFAKT